MRGEQEWRDDVDLGGELDPVGGDDGLVHERARDVREHVDPVDVGLQPVREVTDVVESGEVGDVADDSVGGDGRGQLAHRSVELHRVAPDDVHGRAQTGEPARARRRCRTSLP